MDARAPARPDTGSKRETEWLEGRRRLWGINSRWNIALHDRSGLDKGRPAPLRAAWFLTSPLSCAMTIDADSDPR